MWEERDPRAPRSIAGSRLRHVEMSQSKLAHWPPPQRDVAVKPHVAEPHTPQEEIVAKRPIRRGWHLKDPVT